MAKHPLSENYSRLFNHSLITENIDQALEDMLSKTLMRIAEDYITDKRNDTNLSDENILENFKRILQSATDDVTGILLNQLDNSY